MDSVVDLHRLQLAEKSAVQIQKAGPDYVLDLSVQTSIPDPLIAAACSNFSIRLISRNRLTPVGTLTGHKNTIMKVQFGKTDPHLMFSCSRDKTIRCWDTRTDSRKEVQKYETPKAVQADVLSLDISQSDRLLCAGTEMVKSDSYLLFWDSRQASVLGCYSECHQDDITQVCFQPSSDQYLATGSADGLVCTFDLTEENEDDALQITSNAESDVARIGWCGEACKESVYCVTSDNTFHVWDALEGETYSTMSDFEHLQKSQTADYIVDCLPECTACGDKSSAVLLTGTYSGDLNLVSCTDDDVHTLASLTGGHTDTVRCCHWDTKTKTLLTGAEDSLLCLWSTEASTQSPTTHDRLKAKGKAKSRLSDTGKKPYKKKKE